MFSLAGCGSKPTGELSGFVKYKGKPVVTGTITVYDAEKKAYQGGIDQGQYSVKNVPEGAVQIIVISNDPNTTQGPKLPDGGKRAGREPRPTDATADQPSIAGWFAIPKKYEDPSTSPLKTTMKAGPNPFDIELKD